jgi:hypothetical protein
VVAATTWRLGRLVPLLLNPVSHAVTHIRKTEGFAEPTDCRKD